MTEIDLHKRPVAVRPDGEVQPTKPPPPRPRQNVVGTIVRRPAAVVATVRQSEKTKKVARVVVPPVRITARAAWTTGQGWKRWAKRAADASTHGARREQLQIARALHHYEGVKETLDDLKTDKKIRAALLKDLPGILLGLVQAAGMAICLVVFVLVALGLAIQLTPGGWGWSDWWSAIATVIETIGNVLYLLTVIALWSAGPLVFILGHAEGKKAGTPPRILVTKTERAEMDSKIDERMIALALTRIGNPALNAFFKDGGHLAYRVAPRADGDGTFTSIDLSGIGVAAEEIAAPKQRARLAGNLKRSTLETWPTKGDEDAILDLWVADKGKLSEGAGPWPLQHDGEVDAFEGVPFGRSQRGDVVNARLFETNWLIGGRPGQGKSAAMRTVLLGAALDPTVELWVYVMGESPDFKPFDPRLTRYAMGMDDTVAEQALQALRDLLAEMERRGKVLSAQPGSPPKTSRKLANKRALGLHLLVCAIDEVHELFMHPEFGKEAGELAIRLIKRGRKYGIILILATQSPTATSIPKEVTRNVGCGVAFSVQDHIANDGLLGAGKFRIGIRATELRFNVDRGTCVTVGLTDNTFELIRSFYVPFEDQIDAVTPIIERAMANIKELPRTGHRMPEMIDAPQDHLANILEALEGDTSQRTSVLLGRLRAVLPETYVPFGAKSFAALLDELHVPIRKVGGQSVLRHIDVQQAISEVAQELE